MPTYEYHCAACGSTYELRQGFDAATTQTCAECHKGKAKRVLHAPRVVFKGGGFYATDSKKSTAATKDAKPETDAKPASDTPAKVDAKAESAAPAAAPAASSESAPD